MAVVEIYRSGRQFIVAIGPIGRLVTIADEGERVSPPLPVGSIAAHTHAADPWESMAAADCPPAVRRVAAEMAADPPRAPDPDAPPPGARRP